MVDDREWMRRALRVAERGRGRTTPNPLVGACIVTPDGVLVGHGAHERAGGPHAEAIALDAAGPRARGATLFCTLEPCAHTGRTGPCTERILSAGIRRVVAAIGDPDPRVSGRGFARLRDAGVDVTVGVERAAAARQNAPFLTAKTQDRPFVILKAATSADGCIAERPGERTPLTGEAANRQAHYVRAWVDALAIGVGTLLCDDPLLTVRGVYRERPLARAIFDRRLRTPPDARVLSTLSTGPVIILTSRAATDERPALADALRAAGATVLPVEGDGLGAMLRALAPFDIQSVLLEGGAAVHAAAWDERLVDHVHLYVAPRVIGPGGLPLLADRAFSTAALVDREVEVRGGDVLIRGYVHRLD